MTMPAKPSAGTATAVSNVYTYWSGGSYGNTNLPSGGTWAYFINGWYDASENVIYNSPKAGTASGGTSFPKCIAMIAIRKS